MSVQLLGGPDVDPQKAALIMGASGARTTFAQLRERTDTMVSLLAGRGLRYADHLALLFGNEPQVFPVAWAAQRTGLYFTPINWHLTAAESAYVVGDCDAKILLTSPMQHDLVSAICAAVPSVEPIVIDEAAFPEVSDHGADAELPQEWEGFAMFYSSGTTGKPKGILRAPVRTPAGTTGAIDHLMRSLYGLDSDTVYLSTGPLYHAAPLGWCMSAQRIGGTAVVMERFDAEQTLEYIQRYRVTHVQFVPAMMVRLLRLPKEVRDQYDLSSLRTVIHAAAPCPVEVKREIIEWFGPIVWEYYAGSEGNGYFAIDSTDWLAHPGSVGQAMFGTPHIVDDDGVELPSGEVGTVWMEGTGTFAYHKDSAKTGTAFNRQGWSTLGDLGHLDEDGYLYLSDRRADLILAGGVNIYPQEVENTLVLHPLVFDAAVVGVADEEMGQRVLAIVELEPSVEPTPELAEELIAFCQANLAKFKCPRELKFAPNLPRLPSGKLLRRRIRDEYDPPAG
jgi:long-chain acyl-CoA synthetase